MTKTFLGALPKAAFSTCMNYFMWQDAKSAQNLLSATLEGDLPPAVRAQRERAARYEGIAAKAHATLLCSLIGSTFVYGSLLNASYVSSLLHSDTIFKCYHHTINALLIATGMTGAYSLSGQVCNILYPVHQDPEV